jgi:beta propeller repeat protein
MKNAYSTILLVAVVCAALPAAGLRAAEWQDFEISDTNSSEQAERPDIHGSIAVWQQLVGADYDIYAADITTPESPSVFVVAAYLDDQNAPAVYEDTVVWQDYIADTGWDIYADDIANPAAPFSVCTIDNDQRAPHVHQNTVVWQDNFEGDWDIYGADITDPCSPQEFPVAFFLGNQRSPAIYQNMVVWQDGNDGDLSQTPTAGSIFSSRLSILTSRRRPSTQLQSCGTTISSVTATSLLPISTSRQGPSNSPLVGRVHPRPTPT